MRVIVVARGFLDTNNQVGGFELEQACALKMLGCDVRIIAYDMQSIRHKRKYGIFKLELRGIKCYVCSFPCRILRGGIADSLKNTIMSRLYREATNDGWIPDVIHAHFGYYAHNMLKAVSYSPAKFVITEHYSGMNTLMPSQELLNKSKEAYRAADKLIAVSSGFASVLYKNTGFHFSVVPNLLDPRIFNSSFLSRVKSREDSGVIKIVSAGNLYESKQFPLLIDSLSLLKTYFEFKLSIFGSGPEKKNIEERVSKYNMGDIVSLRGWVSKEELVSEMLESDIFILLSRSETFGLSYVEAMACGLPAVSLRCGGTDDTIQNNKGRILESQDAKGIAEELRMLFKQINSFDRKMIADSTLRYYSSEAVATKLLEIYR